jgi:hypothetical protein
MHELHGPTSTFPAIVTGAICRPNRNRSSWRFLEVARLVIPVFMFLSGALCPRITRWTIGEPFENCDVMLTLQVINGWVCFDCFFLELPL